MAGEVSSAGIVIKFCAEASAGVRPTTGFAEKASGATMNIADYVTGISGLTADFEQYDVTPLSATERHQFIRGLQGNDGNISLAANVNPTSRDDWSKIVDAFNDLSGGLGMWFEFTLPGDTKSVFFRCTPCPMGFPDVEAAQAVQGAIQLIENKYSGWASKSSA